MTKNSANYFKSSAWNGSRRPIVPMIRARCCSPSNGFSSSPIDDFSSYQLPNLSGHARQFKIVTHTREAPMQYVNLGSTGTKVSRICLGCMTYGSKRWREWVLEEE